MTALFFIAFPFAVCAIIYCVQVSFQKKDFKKYRGTERPMTVSANGIIQGICKERAGLIPGTSANH